jgi:hypothetical protein
MGLKKAYTTILQGVGKFTEVCLQMGTQIEKGQIGPQH